MRPSGCVAATLAPCLCRTRQVVAETDRKPSFGQMVRRDHILTIALPQAGNTIGESS